MKYSGISDDGWVAGEAHVALEGGPAADLVLRAHVLPCEGQQLEVRVDEKIVASQPVEAGALDLRLPVAASPAHRRVELRWAKTMALGADDPRQGAALLQFLNVTTQQPPTALRIPGGLSHPAARHSGIHRDGWARQHAQVIIAGGEEAALLVRGTIPETLPDQHLAVTVNGAVAFDEDVPAGELDVRTHVGDSIDVRTIELDWRSVTALSSEDPREASARLTFVGAVSERAPAAITRFPADLADPNLRYTGIFLDGWVQEKAEVILAGGPTAELVIRAQLPSTLDEQQLEVEVDGRALATADAVEGAIDLRVPLPEAPSDRRVGLSWTTTATLSAGDDRSVAALLRFLGVASGRAPNAVARFPHDLDDPNLVSSGIYRDGWSTQEAVVLLAGGAAAGLVVQAQLSPSLSHQHLEVAVDGSPVAATDDVRGTIDLHAELPACDAKRRIVLRWSEVGPVSAVDERPAAALIDTIAIVGPQRSEQRRNARG